MTGVQTCALPIFEFLQRYYFVVKHRAGVENKAADALSRRVSLLSIMSVKVTGFERFRDDYESCPNFGELYTSLSNVPRPILDDYTFKMVTCSKPTSYVSLSLQ